MARLLAVRRPATGRRAPLLLPILLAVCAGPALAQTPGQTSPADWSADIPAHVARVDGQVTLERDGAAQPAAVNLALLAGDRVRTARGRVEVLFADGSALDLDEGSAVDLLSDSLMRLVAGRIRFTIPRVTNALQYRIDGPGASAFIETAGEYRLAVSDAGTDQPRVTLAVVYGLAELANAHGRTELRAGSEAVATAEAAPSIAYAFNSAASDPFDAWADAQREARLGVASAQYLPSDLYYYGGLFDQYGNWEYRPSYGYVWFPRVAVGWRPYSLGHWSFLASFGWLWSGADLWSWPTHHYGRWGLAGTRWFWVPGRRWAPAWVSWASSSGYVSWCPLGVNGRPVVAFARTGEPWHGWTVMRSRAFQARQSVSQHAVPVRALPRTVVTQLAVHRGAPQAAARLRTAGQPLRAPTGAYAVPRRSTGAAVTRSGAAPRSGATARDARTAASPRRAPSAGPQPATVSPARARSSQPRSAPARSAAWPRLAPRASTPAAASAPARTSSYARAASRGGQAAPRATSSALQRRAARPQASPVRPQPYPNRAQPYPNRAQPTPLAPQPAPTRLQPYPAPLGTSRARSRYQPSTRGVPGRPASPSSVRIPQRSAPARGGTIAPRVGRAPTVRPAAPATAAGSRAVSRGRIAPAPRPSVRPSRVAQPQRAAPHAAPRSRGGGGGGSRPAGRRGGGSGR